MNVHALCHAEAPKALAAPVPETETPSHGKKREDQEQDPAHGRRSCRRVSIFQVHARPPDSRDHIEPLRRCDYLTTLSARVQGLRGPSLAPSRCGYVANVRRIGVLASGSGTILHALLAADLPIVVVVVDRECGAIEVARERRRPRRGGRAHQLRARLRPGRVHARSGRRARLVRRRSRGDGRVRHHPREAGPRRLPRSHRQHAPGAACPRSRAGTRSRTRSRRA